MLNITKLHTAYKTASTEAYAPFISSIQTGLVLHVELTGNYFLSVLGGFIYTRFVFLQSV